MKYSKPKNFNSFEKNSRWLDGHKAVRRLAFLRYKLKKICNKCSSRKEIVVHHKNKDRTNNSKENLEILCNSCHNSYHKKGSKWNKPSSFKNKSLEQIYGLEKAKENKKKLSIKSSKDKNGFFGKKWENHGGHPKGFLNHKHLIKSKTAISKSLLKTWAIKKKMNKNKLLYLVWEGPDQSGKTSTRKLVEKQRDGKDVVLDRFIGSNIVYGKVFGRYTKEEIDDLYEDDSEFIYVFKPVLIYLYAPIECLIERIKKDKHEDINSDLLTKTLTEYDEYFEKCHYENKIKIDTNIYNQNEVVRQIINFLSNIENK